MRRGGPQFQRRLPQPMYAQPAPPSTTTRVIWIVLVVIVIGLLFGFVFLLIRDVQRRDSKAEELNVSVDDLLDLYLRTPAEQAEFETQYLKQKARREPAPSNASAPQQLLRDLCPYGECRTTSMPGRRRREADDELTQHGSRVARSGQTSCCLSFPDFFSPTTMVNKGGIPRTLYHEPPNRRQYVVKDLCTGGVLCGGCSCCQEFECISLIVLAPGGGIQIDYFSVESCCKCFF